MGETTGCRKIELAKLDQQRPLCAAVNYYNKAIYVIGGGHPSVFRYNIRGDEKAWETMPKLKHAR